MKRAQKRNHISIWPCDMLARPMIDEPILGMPTRYADRLCRQSMPTGYADKLCRPGLAANTVVRTANARWKFQACEHTKTFTEHEREQFVPCSLVHRTKNTTFNSQVEQNSEQNKDAIEPHNFDILINESRQPDEVRTKQRTQQ